MGDMVGNDRKKEKLARIPLARIRAGSAQPRKAFDADELAELADSIRQNGVLQPILVRRDGAQYEIIAGERRFRAAKLAGLSDIPCVVRTMTDAEAAVAALLENLQRQDLTCFEEAEAIAALIRRWNLTQEQAAAQLGKRQSTVANKLRLLRFSPAERAAILDAHLTERHARALLAVEDETQRQKLIHAAGEQGWTVQQTEQRIAQLNAQASPPPRRTFIAKDVRLFLNTIDHAVQVMRDSGVAAEQEKNEQDDFVEIRIRIPKKEVYAGRSA